MEDGPATLTWTPPAWLRVETVDLAVLSHVDERMRFVIGLAERNVAHQAGAPYAAAVFDSLSGSLIAAAVNLVTTAQCSSAHAEVVALSCAQAAVGNYDLGTGADLQLVTSAEPCLMCLGATFYSGVRSLVCGAREEDWRRFGFDDLGKPANWVGQLEAHGVATTRDVLRDEAIAPFEAYARAGGQAHSGR
jgi:tRNA(Arg) A34 adenosine deaminase TadA